MEIAIISGKGGTGKSSVSAAFASLGKEVVLADCDVDAANLYLLFSPEIDVDEPFTGGEKARIDYKLCLNCGICEKYCRFDAISRIQNKISISEVYCDGCGLCTRVCPSEAITMEKISGSHLYSGSFRYGKMVYGRLAPGEENSGKLVNKVRERAKELAGKANIETILLDGPPGIGCPVLSTITGVDGVVIVTEPSRSGLLDLERTLEIVESYKLPAWVILNKYDLNTEQAEKTEAFCRSKGIQVLARLPFDPLVVDAMVNCRTVPEHQPDSPFARAIEQAWHELMNVQFLK